ncbi:hypothetical protein IAT40_005849 [Kwoniella sp. CBS 6097]
MTVGTVSCHRTRWTEGDGNCMFRAFTKALDNGKRTHEQVRTGGVQWMEENEEDYVHFVDGQFQSYLDKMAEVGTWGDHLVLQAMCEFYGVDVHVLKVDNEDFSWTHVGQVQNPKAAFWLYLKDEHYENLLADSQLARI